VSGLASGAEPVDSRAGALARSRLAFGALLVLRTTPLSAVLSLHDPTPVTTLLGWPSPGFRGATMLDLPVVVVQALCIARTLAALAFVCGYRTRGAGLLAGLTGFAVLSQEPFGFNFTLHLLFLGTIVLALTDCAVVWAVRPEPPRALTSSVWLVGVFVASIYLWAGLYKLRVDWLDGRTLALYHADRALRGALADLLFSSEARRGAVAHAVAFVELSLPPLLLIARTRRLGILLALGFHAAIQLVTTPDLLGFEMAALLLALWPSRTTTAEGAALSRP
jgi:hypothetical protein